MCHQVRTKELFILEMPHQFQCRLCSQTFILVTDFIEHVKIHKKAAENPNTQNEKDIDVTELSAKSQETVNENKIRKANWCRICDKTFSSKSYLRRHRITVHEEGKIHRCDLCNKSFGEKGTLQKHEKTVHDKIKSYKCDSCDRKFGQKAHLESHVKSVHEKINSSYKCDCCDKVFVTIVTFINTFDIFMNCLDMSF